MYFSVRPYSGSSVELPGQVSVIAHASDGSVAVIASFPSRLAAGELASVLNAAAHFTLRSEAEGENIRVERPSKGNG